MIGIRAHRSIVFQLWLRLSVITVSFTMLALVAYIWIDINDNIDTARSQATANAGAVASSISRMTAAGSSPTAAELGVAGTLGVQAIQLLDSQGNVLVSLGTLQGPGVETPAAVENGTPVKVLGEDVRISGDGFAPAKIRALDLLNGGEYGGIFVYPAGAREPSGAIRIIITYEDLSRDAQTLLFRTLVLTGAILAVAIAAMWVLMNRFVAQPLREYSRTALRIAAGEPLRMPELGHNELGDLGQAINGMAAILRHEATVDPLTGLYNIRHLTMSLEDFLMEARAQNQSLALLVCDLDNLKPINDGYGHQTGDLLLKAIARHLQLWAGLEYTCWRIGGDEFAAIIPNTNAEQALIEADSLGRAVSATSFHAPDDHYLRVSLSIGVATFPEDGTTGAALLKVADMRMYEAKSHKARDGLPRAVDDQPAAAA